MKTIDVKILGPRRSQRYVVQRILLVALDELRKAHPAFEITVSEVRTIAEMGRYTQVAILPSLVVNEKLVCVGRFPKKEEVILWLKEALEALA